MQFVLLWMIHFNLNRGHKYQYTTLGYNLLAGIIENVSGMSFEEYLSKNIFQPAEMTLNILRISAKNNF